MNGRKAKLIRQYCRATGTNYKRMKKHYRTMTEKERWAFGRLARMAIEHRVRYAPTFEAASAIEVGDGVAIGADGKARPINE